MLDCALMIPGLCSQKSSQQSSLLDDEAAARADRGTIDNEILQTLAVGGAETFDIDGELIDHSTTARRKNQQPG